MKIRPSMLPVLLGLMAGGLQAQEAKPVDTTPKLTYGQMIKQGDKLVFAPCRDRSYAMVEDVSADRSVTRGLGFVGLDSGKKLYVELKGVLDDSGLKASALNLARTDGRCQQPGGKDEAWRAAGNEPGWMLAAGGEEMLLKRQGKPDLLLPYAPFQTEGGVARYTVSKGQQTLSVRFEPTLCRDPGADSVFGWTATVTLNGEVFKGCAWQR